MELLYTTEDGGDIKHNQNKHKMAPYGLSCIIQVCGSPESMLNLTEVGAQACLILHQGCK